jgi:hypothetical protein
MANGLEDRVAALEVQVTAMRAFIWASLMSNPPAKPVPGGAVQAVLMTIVSQHTTEQQRREMASEIERLTALQNSGNRS